jgi:hypothetical protein
MRHTADGCPRCHAPAPADPVSTTRFRAWLLCLSCGHVWTVSRLTLAFFACTRQRRRVVPEPPAADDVADLVAMDTTLPMADGEADPALESWLAGIEPASPGGQTWNSVNAWLDSDPLPVVTTACGSALEDEWGLRRRPEPVRPAPRTLLERLDALYQGMLQLERFVEKSARMEEAIVAASAPEAPAVALPRPRPRPRLVRRHEGTPHEPAAA